MPGYAEARYGLGNALAKAGRASDAIAACQEAVRLNPGLAEAHVNLGHLLIKFGRVEDAIAAYRKALELEPGDFKACAYLADALREAGRLDESIARSRQAIAMKPDFAEAHNALGLALTAAKRFDDAVAQLNRSLQLRPGYSGARNNLGRALYQAGRIDEAILEYRRALELDPDDPQFLTNLGLGLWAIGRQDEAIAAYRQAIGRKHDYFEAHYNLAVSLLLKGEFEEGWREHEHRWQIKGLQAPARICSQPRWRGEDLQGRTILLDAEQGYGDVIHFVRYVPEIARRGGRVILFCYAELVPLLRRQLGIEQVISTNPPPPFDVHCPLLDIPFVLGTRRSSIPADVPYLKADPALAEAWGRKLDPRTGRLRVGLVWAGQPLNIRDGERSIAFSMLAPLVRTTGVTFYSLQTGDAASQAKHPPRGMELIDLTADIRDFADTAALISHLDLVISVDTAVAHLAGAMAKPVWVMITSVPDWRWLLDREDSPWYPTMRLFRQTVRGHWDDVVRRVAEALRAFAL